jgi:putative oxidoreductase
LSLSLADRVTGGGLIWLLGRVLIGGLFFVSGAQKLMGLDEFASLLVQSGIPDSIAPMLAPLAALTETLGGLCIVLGFATGWASLVLIAFTVVAGLAAHRFWEFEGELRMNQTAHFMKNMMIVGAFCLLYVAGGGPFSIDRWRRYRGGSLR